PERRTRGLYVPDSNLRTLYLSNSTMRLHTDMIETKQAKYGLSKQENDLPEENQ
ncbi:15094_t:CDS:2, partial [Gigaspora margarita]